MQSFNIGLDGLQTTSRAIEVASTNVANAGTIGYKAGDYLFAEEVLRVTQVADDRGGGVSELGVKRIHEQGTLRSTGSVLDLAVSGRGMFRLVGSLDGDNPTSTYYTRNGQFSVDKDGYVVNANGLYLTGYRATADGQGLGQSIGPLKLPSGPAAPRATTEASLSIGLDARKAPPTGASGGGAIFDPLDPTTFSHSTTTNVYDSQGVKRAVSLYFQRQPDETVALTPDAADPARRSFKDPATGETVASANVTRYRLYAAVDGAWLSLSGTGASARQGAAAPDFAADPPGLALDTLEFYDGVSLASLQGRRDRLPIRYEYAEPAAGGAAPSNRVLGFSLDLTDATNYAETFAVRDARQDGYPTGSLSGIQVDETGRLLGEYTNGKTLTSGQVVLADFVGMGGLSLVGPNVFAQTGASGEPRLGTGSVQGFGAIRASALEEANIDMASELVKLMVQQRNYQANAQSIRTADSLISTIINMRG